MGATREQRILNTLKKKEYAPQTSIATDMFLPNLSGIAAHPEAKATFLKLDCSNDPLTADLEVTGNLLVKHSTQPAITLNSTGVNQSAYLNLTATGSGSGIIVAPAALQFRTAGLGEVARFHQTTGNLVMNTHKITGVVDPTADQDAATKKYVNDEDHTQNTDTALGSGCVAADHGTAATDQVVNVCYGTGDPPAANTTTIGTLFVKYTA